ncbi:MAG: hypothetical protein ACE5EZ_05430 [Thermodesulfobacteriota bacterium]
MKRQNIIYIEGETMQAVRACKGRGRVRVEETETFAADRLEEYLRGSNERNYTLVVNFKTFFHETITLPAVKGRYMEKVIASEISRVSTFTRFSFIYSLAEETTIDNKKKRIVHVFAVDMEELQEVIRRFTACDVEVRAVYPDIYAVKSLLGEKASGLGLFNAGHEDEHEQKMFLVKNGEVLFIRDARHGAKDPLETETRNIYLSVSYCQQTLRENPERLFLIGETSYLAGAEALTLPAAPVPRPVGLVAGEEIFEKYAVPLSALYAGKAMDISPKFLRAEHLREQVQRYGAAAFFVLGFVGLIYLAFTVEGTVAASERLDMQKNRLAHMYGLQSEYMKTLSKYAQYRAFLKDGQKNTFARFFLNLSALNEPGVIIEKLSATLGEDGFSVTLNGRIEAGSLRDTQARYDGLLEFIAGPGAMTVKEDKLLFSDNSFRLTAGLR